jgi:hypothetical protein
MHDPASFDAKCVLRAATGGNDLHDGKFGIRIPIFGNAGAAMVPNRAAHGERGGGK